MAFGGETIVYPTYGHTLALAAPALSHYGRRTCVSGLEKGWFIRKTPGDVAQRLFLLLGSSGARPLGAQHQMPDPSRDVRVIAKEGSTTSTRIWPCMM